MLTKTFALNHRNPALTLKSTPPRVPKGLQNRERLSLQRLALSGNHVVAVLAPAGFGKTTQLAMWRQEVLGRGALALWLSIDSDDEPMRLVRGLTHCARDVCGKIGFGDDFMDWMAQEQRPSKAITGWLAEVATLSVEVLLLLDNVEQMPEASRTQVFNLLLRYAPPNLSVALAARSAAKLPLSDALSPAKISFVMAHDLRLTLDETMSVLSSALGARCTPSANLRLHEITDGWPQGLQLAMGPMTRGGDSEGLVAAASCDIQRYLVDTFIDRQSEEVQGVLVRMARFNLIEPALCSAVLGNDHYGQILLHIQDETPLLQSTGTDGWMRWHPLARETLSGRLRQVPAVQLTALSRTASQWYAERELFEKAAEQALLAGDESQAVDLIERSSQRMGVQGRGGAVLPWYERLSSAELRKRPAFWAPTAWALLLQYERHTETHMLVSLILELPNVTPEQRYEAALISHGAAMFADRVDQGGQLLAPWPEPPLLTRPTLVPIHHVAMGNLAMSMGQPDQALLHFSRIGWLDRAISYSPPTYAFADLGVGLCHLLEGRVPLAGETLRPALARAEARLDRLHPVSCMLAAALALACWEGGLNEDALALLAGRMDILNRFALPEALMAAYRTLARIADSDGRQDQSMSLLESLRALGLKRDMIRLQVLALAEMVSLHVRHGRANMARIHADELEALIRNPSKTSTTIFQPWLELHMLKARAQATLVQDDDGLMIQALKDTEAAASLAMSLKRDGDVAEIRLLQAEAMRRAGAADARSVRAEALSMAKAEGMLRLLREQGTRRGPTDSAVQEVSDAAPRNAQVRGASVLTGKEREVLILLNRNLSNKEAALALGVGEQTVKWHVKNLFEKLNAANRKHAVARARLLGLIED